MSRPRALILLILATASSSMANISASGEEATISMVLGARDGWADTGLVLQQGTSLQIEASGRWSNGGAQPHFVDAGGFRDYRLPNTLLPSAPLASLLAKVDRAIFLVGTSYSGSPGLGGLFLSMNDVAGTFEDNEGELTIRIFYRRPEAQPRLREYEVRGGADANPVVRGELFNPRQAGLPLPHTVPEKSLEPFSKVITGETMLGPGESKAVAVPLTEPSAVYASALWRDGDGPLRLQVTQDNSIVAEGVVIHGERRGNVGTRARVIAGSATVVVRNLGATSAKVTIAIDHAPLAALGGTP